MSTYKSAADQWGFPPENNNSEKTSGINTETKKEETPLNETNEKDEKPSATISFSESLKRRGFFEAISKVSCPLDKLDMIRREYEQEAERRLNEINSIAEAQLHYIEESIASLSAKLQEIKERLATARAYKEEEDAILQKLVSEQWQKEQELLELQNRLTAARIRLGEAKAGIINQSLDEAEQQIIKALRIQETIYDGNFRMARQKFDDEKEHLSKLADCYRQLYDHYKERYEKVKKYLSILDVDGISPVTTYALRSIAGTSFIAAGFFFSTFAAATGFGNKDLLYFILGGVLNTANDSMGWIWKIAILLVLIGLITGISWLCYWLIQRLKKKSDEEIISEMLLGVASSKKIDRMGYTTNIKSNNWYAFWLQMVPFVLIVGLLALCVAFKAKDELNSLNASSEGLIVGSFVALALGGLIYLYVIKIVEPRLVHKQDTGNWKYVNWAWANRELVITLILFLIFTICIVAIPYNTSTVSAGIPLIPADQSTRYAILLFIGMSLVGGITFAYGIRSQGLIDTSRFLERVMFRLNNAIAVCTAPKAPALPSEIKDRHKNIVQHVLKQLSFNAAVNKNKMVRPKRSLSEQNPFAWVVNKIIRRKEPPPVTEPYQAMVIMEPWEERYFPHIVEELKSLEFEYREQKTRVLKAQEELAAYKAKKEAELRKYELEVNALETDIDLVKQRREDVEEEKANSRVSMNEHLEGCMNDILDGFHLGMWYRDNGIGPTPVFYQPCPDNDPGLGSPILLPAIIKQ